MNNTSRTLLKKLVAERELSLAELNEMIPKKYNDYRDYFILANLCTEGLARTEVRLANSQEKLDEKFLASYFFAHCLGIGAHKVNMYNAINRGGDEDLIKVYATSKADTYLSERKAKMTERGIGFILGIATTVLGKLIIEIFFAV